METGTTDPGAEAANADDVRVLPAATVGCKQTT